MSRLFIEPPGIYSPDWRVYREVEGGNDELLSLHSRQEWAEEALEDWREYFLEELAYQMNGEMSR